jgi:hypothetical protein
LTSCLLGGFCIGHDYQTAFEEEALIGVRRLGVNAGRAMRLPGRPARRPPRRRDARAGEITRADGSTVAPSRFVPG